MTQAETSALKELLDTHVQNEGLRPFARRTGIPIGVIRSIQEGRDVLASNIRLVSDVMGMEFYVGPKRESVVPAEAHADHDIPVVLVDRFNLAVSAGGGSADVAVPATPMPFGADWLRRHSIKASDISLLEVRGDSMEPVLFEGDSILVDKRASKPLTGKMYVVVRQHGVQVKWVHVGRKTVTLISENGEGHGPEKLDPRETPEPEFYRVRWFGHFLD
ncbi:MAG: S24 family peptidase [Devosia sp.]|nr:S24 family peptidase [Devosia sp.]